jgi:hypothetical protein
MQKTTNERKNSKNNTFSILTLAVGGIKTEIAVLDAKTSKITHIPRGKVKWFLARLTTP